MKNLRTQGKSTVVWILMGLLILGLGGFGVTSFTGGSSEIGAVGDTKVTADEYARALRSQINAYARQMGQPISMAQAQAMGLPQAVQAQLLTAAALEEQARRLGVSVGDARVQQTILDADAFRGPNGSFDRVAYSEVLSREGLSEADFERTVRADEARLLIQKAVIGGIGAPDAMVEQTAKWLLETRDIAWHELTEDQLPAPVAEPDEETLKAWHQANADRFTAPEIRRLTYAWVTPEMLADEVELDEDALRAVYEANIDQYRQPERRMVSRLVFPSQEAAEEAKALIDAGEKPFEAFVIERGLTLEDVDLGELSRDELGEAGDAVFALTEPGVTGPVEIGLGPALFAMNAILEPVEIPFEEAREDLRAEAAADRAARMIEDRSTDIEDLLAGGATLEDLAEETELELGRIDWSAAEDVPQGSIAGYEAFRTEAAAVTETDFPQLLQLDDGGIFALRLDEIVAPTLIPFEEVRDRVARDWHDSEVSRQLLALAEERKVEVTAAAAPTPEPMIPAENTSRVARPETPAAEQPETRAGTEGGQQRNAAERPDAAWQSEAGLRRDGWIEVLPGDVVQAAFELEAPEEVEIVEAEDRIFLIRLDAIGDADLEGEEALRVLDAVRQRLGQSLQADLFDYYARAAQLQGGLQLNQAAINAINAQVQ